VYEPQEMSLIKKFYSISCWDERKRHFFFFFFVYSHQKRIKTIFYLASPRWKVMIKNAKKLCSTLFRNEIIFSCFLTDQKNIILTPYKSSFIKGWDQRKRIFLTEYFELTNLKTFFSKIIKRSTNFELVVWKAKN
jgi:hypothetical protein